MRILLCPHCRRQWEATAYAVGQKLRCLCGFLMTVPQSRAHAPRVRHCPGCGAARPRASGSCTFCGTAAPVDPSELGLVCPFCFCQAPNASQFCPSCGEKLSPAPLALGPGKAACPRCRADRMLGRSVGDLQMEECPVCAGMWIETTAFERIVESQQARARTDPTALRQAGPARAQLPAEPVTYLRCPTCGKPMNRKNYGRASGVLIDECSAHGYWLDAHELEKVARYVATGGLHHSARLQEADRAPSAPAGSGAPFHLDREDDETLLSRVLTAILDEVVKLR